MLELKNISFQVSDEEAAQNAEDHSGVKEIIQDVNLSLGSGKFIVVTGPNGGGKSTLAKLIAGIEQPTTGSVIFNGKDITGLGIEERAKMGISYAFQTPVKFKGLTVQDLIRIASGRQISLSEACDYLSEVGLCAKDYITREVNDSLSGGELKRVEIATVLARNCEFSIFDEPEAGIDLWSFQNLIHIFEKMQAENKNNTILVISHQERILNIADEIILISDGKVSKHGPRDEILPELTGSDNAVNPCEKITLGGEPK